MRGGERGDRVHLAVTIDTECDKGLRWQVRQPLSFTNVVEGVPGRLQPVFEKHGVRPTYLVSPEVLEDDRSVEVLRRLAPNAELGAHLHGEFLGPRADRGVARTVSLQRDLPPEAEKEKLSRLTDLFTDRVGHAPLSFRAGRFGIGARTLGFLEGLGYTVDSSVVPFRWDWSTGTNHLGAPSGPYRPLAEDYRRRGGKGILEVPVTAVNPFLGTFPQAVLRSMNPMNRWQMYPLKMLAGKRLAPRWLRPTYSSAEEMAAVSRYLWRKGESGETVLCMMFHSSEATAATSPYNDSEVSVRDFLTRIDAYLVLLREEFHVKHVTLSEIPGLANW